MLSCSRRAEATKKLRATEAANPKPQDCAPSRIWARTRVSNLRLTAANQRFLRFADLSVWILF